MAGISVGRELGLSWGQSLLFLTPIVCLEGVLRLAVARRRLHFERALAQALASSAGAREVLALIRGERLLRFAAPGSYLQGKLGAVHRHFKNHRAAADAFQLAVEEAPQGSRYALALGLADSLYELGEARDAERVYRSALDDTHATARACANLARLVLRRAGDRGEAEGLLRRSLDQQPDLRVRSELIQLLAGEGKLEEADWQLQLAAEELAAGGDRDAYQAAREAVDAALARSSTPAGAAASPEPPR